MFTINSIIKEINDLPADRLEEVYDFVHSLKNNNKKIKKSRKKILSFAGAFRDMPKKDYNEFMKHIKTVRQNFLDRNMDL